jgi:hypothetical protein
LTALLQTESAWALADAANSAATAAHVAATVNLERMATSWVSGHRSALDRRGSR